MKLYLDEWIRYRGLNLAKLAAIIGMERASISRIKKKSSGDPESMRKIAQGLRCTIEELWSLPPILSAESIGLPKIQLSDLLSKEVSLNGVKLTEEQKKSLLEYAEFILKRKEG